MVATIKDVREFFDSPARPMPLSQFKVEWAQLTQQDKDEIKAGLSDGSLTY